MIYYTRKLLNKRRERVIIQLPVFGPINGKGTGRAKESPILTEKPNALGNLINVVVGMSLVQPTQNAPRLFLTPLKKVWGDFYSLKSSLPWILPRTVYRWIHSIQGTYEIDSFLFYQIQYRVANTITIYGKIAHLCPTANFLPSTRYEPLS